MLTDLQELQLTGAGDTLLHYHLADRVPTLETVNGLNKITSGQVVDADATLTYEDTTVLVDTSTANRTITLPPARDGKEFEVVKLVDANYIEILPSGTDTLLGETSVIVYDRWTALHFKAIDGGYCLI